LGEDGGADSVFAGYVGKDGTQLDYTTISAPTDERMGIRTWAMPLAARRTWTSPLGKTPRAASSRSCTGSPERNVIDTMDQIKAALLRLDAAQRLSHKDLS
jgi:hypothetical protein